jgi:hypothetical protein
VLRLHMPSMGKGPVKIIDSATQRSRVLLFFTYEKGYLCGQTRSTLVGLGEEHA